MAVSNHRQPIARQIYFYQMADILDLWRSSTLPTFSPALLAADLAALQDDALLLHTNDEYGVCLLSDGDGKFRFGKARVPEMSRVLDRRTVKPLRLNVGQKLFDCIHIVFFPSGVVGAEFSLIGPKMPTLSEYLDSKLTSCMPVAFDRLVHTDVMERLSHLREIKLVEMRVDTNRSEVLAPFGNGWIDTSKWMRDQFGVGSVEVLLRAGTTAHRALPEKVLTALREMFSSTKIRESTDKFKIRAVPEGSKLAIDIDLLDDKLMAPVDIPRDVFRQPDRYKEFMYNKIRETYSGLKQDILHAARIVSWAS